MESTTQIFLRVQETEDDSSFVAGEARATGYADRVQIDSYNFGMEALEQAPGQGKWAKLKFNNVQVTKFFDRSSARLAALLKESREKPKLLHEVRITVDQQLEEAGVGKAQNAILVFHLARARIIDIKLDVSGDSRSTTIKETVSFSFKNFSVDYYFKGMNNNKKSDYRDQGKSFKSNEEEQDED